MSTFRDAAIALAQAGFRVFPLAPGTKVPAFEGDWQRRATSDIQAITDIWTDDITGWDQPYNIGVALSADVLVVDVDVRGGKPGAHSLRLLEALYDPLPETYTTTTASGGQHRYFRIKDIPAVGKILANGIDLKTAGGYVVGAGSVIGAGSYTAAGDPTRLAELPQPFVELARRSERPAPAAKNVSIELDSNDAISRAIDYLTREAPDAGTYKVAAKVKDYGVSEAVAVDLLCEHWAEPRSLGKDRDHIAVRVANAYTYGKSPVGIASPEAEFEAVEVADKRPPSTVLRPEPLTAEDIGTLPPRQWLYGKKLSRKYTAFVASPGGVGKTAWATALALACASGQKLLHDKPHHPMRVWLYNLEDDRVELRRRVAAAMTSYGLPPETLDNLRLNSGRDRGLKIVKMREDAFVVQPDAKALVDVMRADAIEVLIVDPYLRSHAVPENANEAQDEVMRLYANIADKTNAAILLVHHTKKGAGDSIDALRGGSSQGGGARSVFLMSAMSVEEAGKLGIPERKRKLHVRIDDPKNNMAPPAGDAEWIRLSSTNLDNATKDYPEGDSVQVARPWTPPSVWEGTEETEVEACIAAIASGIGDGEYYSSRVQDRDRWAGEVIVERLRRTEDQAKEILKLWLASRRLVVEDYRSEAQRKRRKGLFAPRNVLQ